MPKIRADVPINPAQMISALSVDGYTVRNNGDGTVEVDGASESDVRAAVDELVYNLEVDATELLEDRIVDLWSRIDRAASGNITSGMIRMYGRKF